jgi:hypothetical protein
MFNIFQRTFAKIVAKIEKPKKERAIRLYAGRLGRLLQATYGKQEKYTPTQVKKTMQAWGYTTDYDCFGLAMYCDFDDFSDYHRSIGESCNYERMRSEISYCLFGSALTEFDAPTLIESEFNFDSPGHHHSSGDTHVSHHNHHHDGGGATDAGHHSHHDAGGYAGGSDFGGGDY